MSEIPSLVDRRLTWKCEPDRVLPIDSPCDTLVRPSADEDGSVLLLPISFIGMASDSVSGL